MVKSKRLFDSLIYFIRYDGSTLTVGNDEFPEAVLDMLIQNNGLLIWENQGTFRLIPAPVIHNIWLASVASDQLKKEYPRAEISHGLNAVSWKQGLLISPIVARNFLTVPHEKRKGFADTNPAPEPTSEDQTDDPQTDAG